MTAVTSTPQPDLADEIAAGRPYPLRDWRKPLNRDTLRELEDARRQWWLDAAAGFADLADHAETLAEVREIADDARAALSAATFHGARTVRL